MIQKHNLNAADAAILTALLEFINLSGMMPCILVACDKRLLRAAAAEGVQTLNPENLLADSVPSVLV